MQQSPASPQSPEQTLAVVPRVNMFGAFQRSTVTMVVTNYRTIFTGIESAATADAEALARDPSSVVVPHAAVQRLKFNKGLAACAFGLVYALPDGRKKKIQGFFNPSPEQVRSGRAAGLRWRDMVADNARYVQSAYQRALPPDVAARVQWDM